MAVMYGSGRGDVKYYVNKDGEQMLDAVLIFAERYDETHTDEWVILSDDIAVEPSKILWDYAPELFIEKMDEYLKANGWEPVYE